MTEDNQRKDDNVEATVTQGPAFDDEAAPELLTSDADGGTESEAEPAPSDEARAKPSLQAKLSQVLETVKGFVRDFFEANFKAGDTGHQKEKKIDDSPVGLRSGSGKKMDRAVKAVLNDPVSSTKGGPKREKKKVVTSKTYKPELNRF